MKRLDKKELLIIMVLLITNSLFSQQAFTVSTFHNLSVYWSPNSGAMDKGVTVAFKPAGSEIWQAGLAMKYNPIVGSGNNPLTGERYDKADYRGSIVNLQPNTTYDIQLTVEGSNETTTLQGATWSEEFPIAQTTYPGSLNTRVTYNLNGTPEGYILIDGTGETIDIQDGSDQCIALVNSSYVIIRGFTLTNAAHSAIRLFSSHHIVIEDCDMSGWGSEDVPGTGFGQAYQAGVFAGANQIYSCVIQRNKIHNPKWDSNSWAELHDPAADPNDNGNYHPSGPQGISLGQCSIGNNVIRYNEFWSDEDHYFNDIIGMWENSSYAGFPGPDSDIYNNYLANCFDDGIESEGCNTNVRIWNNYIDNVFIGIANAATSVGPLYIWRNVIGRADSNPESVFGQYGPCIKMGYAGTIDWMTGHMYIFNNTILQPNDHGCGGLGTSEDADRYIRHCVTRNNIFQVREATTHSIAIKNGNLDFSYDYDLTNHPYPDGEESHGITGMPTYQNGVPSFNFNTMTGDFRLSTSSLGYDDGVVIPNFCSDYVGVAPDMGAHENGWDEMEYGTLATFYPPSSSSSAVVLSIKAMLQGAYDANANMMKDEIRQLGVLPLIEPFTGLGYTHVGGGGESTQAQVLNVTGNNAIVDWILVELRGGIIPDGVVATKSALIQRDGDIVGMDGVSPLSFVRDNLPDNVYIVLRHRNHLGVKALIAYSIVAPIFIDFTDPNTAVLGDDSMVLLDGKNLLVSGDANGDGAINSNDKNNHWNLQNAEPFDYYNASADFNLDGVVNAVDRNQYWRLNNGRSEAL